MKTQKWIWTFSVSLLMGLPAFAYLSEEPLPAGQFALKTLEHPHKVGTTTVKPARAGAKIEFEGQSLKKGKYRLLMSLQCLTPKEFRARKPANAGTEVAEFTTESGEMWIEHTLKSEEVSLEKPDQPVEFFLERVSGGHHELVAASPCGVVNPTPPPEVPAVVPETPATNPG